MKMEWTSPARAAWSDLPRKLTGRRRRRRRRLEETPLLHLFRLRMMPPPTVPSSPSPAGPSFPPWNARQISLSSGPEQ